MGRILTRIIGILLVIAGVAGLIFAVAGQFVLAEVEKNVTAAAQEQIALVAQALTATSEGLDVAANSLNEAVATVKALETTVAGVGGTVGSSLDVLDTVSTVIGDKLPATIEAAQQTLTSVATSSQVIDNLLAVLSAIPFLGVDKYSPDVPLSQGFEDMAKSLDEIPASLRDTKTQLASTNEYLSSMEGSFQTMAGNIGQISTAVAGAQAVLGQYHGVIGQLQSSIAWISTSLPIWLNWVRWGLALVLIWLGIAQFALITQGWELIGRSKRQRAPEPQAETAEK